MLTTVDAICTPDDRPPPVVLFIDEWKDSVYLRHPSANERDIWELYCTNMKEKGNEKKPFRAKLASMLLCDEKGKLLFSAHQVEKLGERSAVALHRIWEKGIEMMSISEAEVVELEKN